ncbi:MAG: tyrosine--tRNA ligase [Nitrospirae bacterium]|nr:tyrosine--tRNA ligase [Nitrospirota bacterium]
MVIKNIEEHLKLIRRGCVEIISEEELIKKLEWSIKEKIPLKIKAGFDPTMPDLHLGHTVLLYKLKQFQDLGHKVLFLIGDFTGMIGDPSGVSETRKALTKEDVLNNASTYERQVFKILDPARTEVVFNSTWMSRMTGEELIRLCGKYTVARMLEREDFKKRYTTGKPISIHEFLYPLIQGYDSLMLKADVEVGGTDQKFNLLVGRDLQREEGQSPQVVLTMPLLEGLDGVKKMSKSQKNYIGIEEPPHEIFGKIMSVDDRLMLKYYELLSNQDIEYIKTIHPMEAKKNLAGEIVERFYNKEIAVEARNDFEKVFSKRDSIPSDIPVYTVEDGKRWLPHVLTASGITKSNSEAIRLIREGAVELDGMRAAEINVELPEGREQIVKIGKKRFLKINS